MPFGAFDPHRAVAIVLGAREFPKAISLELHGIRFSNSAFAFRKYLIEKLGIPRRNVLDLFDDASSPDQLLGNIRDFLDRRIDELKNAPLQDLFFYYVGHGFLEGRGISDLHLAIRQTDTDGLSYTALDIRSLANVIRSRARFVRRYLILDCCYGAAASRAWSQSDGPARLAMRSTLDVFPSESPTRGTAVLSAAESDKEANALGKHEFTSFSDGLLQCLDHGREELGEKISLEDLHWMLLDYLRSNYSDTDTFVRPKVESPEASEGDVAWLPIFPNPAYRRALGVAGQQREEAEARERIETERRAQEYATELQRNAAAQKAREEAEARERAETERKAQEYATELQRNAAAQKAREEAEARERAETERKVQEYATELQRNAAAQRARKEAEARERIETERRAQEYATELQRNAAAQKAREEAEARERAETERKAQEYATELQRKAAAQKARKKLAIAALCFISLILGIGSEIGTSYVIAGSGSDLFYYVCAAVAGSIEGMIYAFVLFDKVQVTQLHSYLVAGSWALGWVTMAHSGFDPLAGVLSGAIIPLLVFIRNRTSK